MKQFFRYPAVALAIAVLLLLSACSGAATPAANTAVAPTVPATANANQVGATATVPPTQAAAPASGDARQAVINALKAVSTAGPYHVKITTGLGSSTSHVIDGDIILPDHFHLNMQGREMLIIASKTYMKANGKWVEFPIDMGSLIQGMVGTLTEDILNGVSNAKLVGPDTVNGKAATLYTFDEAYTLDGKPYTSQNKLWVDSLRGLPIQQQVDGVVNGAASSTIQVITYDPTIKIDTP